jgi:hypothetical protein
VTTRTIYEVPLGPGATDTVIRIGARYCRFRTQYRVATEGGWLLDLTSQEVDRPFVIRGIPLVSGLDLLWQYGYMNVGFHLLMQCRDGRDAPTYESLGQEDKLVAVVTTEEAS